MIIQNMVSRDGKKERKVVMEFNPNDTKDACWIVLIIERLIEAQKTMNVQDQGLEKLYGEMVRNYVLVSAHDTPDT